MPTQKTPLDAIRNSASARFSAMEGSPDLLVVFSERSQGYRHPNSFSCGGALQNAGFNRLLLRDMRSLWYHGGLDAITDSLPGTIAFLREFIEAGAFRTVSVLGVSSGSHAAFVTGAVIPVDAVICVGCRFDLRQDTRDQNMKPGTELRERLDQLWTDPGLDRRYLNARDAATAPGAAASPVRLYYDPKNWTDSRHAGFVEDLPTVTTVPCPGQGHNVHSLTRTVFERDPLLGGRATYKDPTAKLDRKKLATGSKLRAALLSATQTSGTQDP